MRAFFSGGCSSVGRVPDCDSGCRGFEPHQSPQLAQVANSGSSSKTENPALAAGFYFSRVENEFSRNSWRSAECFSG